VVFQDFFGETDAGWRQLGKIRLRVSKHPITGLDVKPLGIFGDDDRVALGDVVALARFRRQDDSSRCIHFEVVDLLLALHEDKALNVVDGVCQGTMTENTASSKCSVISRFIATTGFLTAAPFGRYPLRDKPDYRGLSVFGDKGHHHI